MPLLIKFAYFDIDVLRDVLTEFGILVLINKYTMKNYFFYITHC